MNVFDRMIAAISPKMGFERSRYRAMMAAYEASRPGRLRKFSRDRQSGDAIARMEHQPLRDQARNLDRNHDLVAGALDTMVANIVGAQGITIEPQPRSVSGEILDSLAEQLTELWRDWCRFPEVTFAMNWAAVQRLACLTWLRDGEAFSQILEGTIGGLDHRTKVPLSIELLEPDMVPTDAEMMLRDGQGTVIRNGWGQAVAYRVYKAHPGDVFLWRAIAEVKTIRADRMLHLKLIRRIGQSRGITRLASVITRLEDLKDYEESERIAAKIASSMAGFIKKGSPDFYKPDDSGDEPAPRQMKFQPGMIFDDLLPGEEIGTIDSNRPNPNLPAHRDGQLRAASAGIGISASSFSRNYNGTYSAQRQELVEQYAHYAILSESFSSQFVQPIWERFAALANIAGLIDVPADIQPDTLDDALYIPPSMPWIDPKKEAEGLESLNANHWLSDQEIIRRRGANPRDVLNQIAKWERMEKAAGLNAAVPAATSTTQADPTNEDQPNDPAMV